jgi:hypothetical protein
MVRSISLKYLVHSTHCRPLFCYCTPNLKWVIARWFPQEWKMILILGSLRCCCHDPFSNNGLSFQFSLFVFIHSLTWSKSTRCTQQMALYSEVGALKSIHAKITCPKNITSPLYLGLGPLMSCYILPQWIL